MPVDNLAKVFGPTIVGYSSEDLTRDALLTQTTQQTIVGVLKQSNVILHEVFSVLR